MRDFDEVLAAAIRDADDLDGLTDGNGNYTDASVCAWLVQHPGND